jgi:mitochondrial fission protein ELM1
LLIGGGDRYHTIRRQTISNLLYILRKLSQELDLQILLATSRRTPPTINNLIAEEMLDTPVCPICVLADRQNKYTVTDIFSLSDLLIVTEDSFSMVCEAASSGRKLVILRVNRRISKSPRQDLVYNEMVQMEHIKWVRLAEIKTTIPSLIEQKMEIKPLRDSDTAANAVLRLLDRH